MLGEIHTRKKRNDVVDGIMAVADVVGAFVPVVGIVKDIVCLFICGRFTINLVEMSDYFARSTVLIFNRGSIYSKQFL